MKHVLTVNKILFVFCLFCVNVFAAEFGLIEKDDDFNKIHVKDEGGIKYIYICYKSKNITSFAFQR